MTLYIAVTPDRLELPLYVTDSVKDMAKWAGVNASSVRQMCSRNKDKLPFVGRNGGHIHSKHRIRSITIEED